MKPKILTWIIILLLIMNVSAIVTMLYHKSQEEKAEIVSGNPVAAIQSGPTMKYSGRRFRDELGLTSDQMREFSRFNPIFRQKLRDLNIRLLRKRQEMIDELAVDKSDTTMLNSLSYSIGELHSELKKATYAYYLEFKRICTPEQKEKLNSIFNNMFEGETPVVGPGRGMQGRGRLGMRNRNNQKL
jgi:Spy/CpxP family protein refolding chaperone